MLWLFCPAVLNLYGRCYIIAKKYPLFEAHSFTPVLHAFLLLLMFCVNDSTINLVQDVT